MCPLRARRETSPETRGSGRAAPAPLGSLAPSLNSRDIAARAPAAGHRPKSIADCAFADCALRRAIVAAMLEVGGFLALLRARRPGRWAALSVASPVLVLVIAYWRLHPYGLDMDWSAVALLADRGRLCLSPAPATAGRPWRRGYAASPIRGVNLRGILGRETFLICGFGPPLRMRVQCE